MVFFHQRRAAMNVYIEVLRAIPGIRELLLTDGWQVDEQEAPGLRASLSGIQD
jgi:hypothetical protein